MNEFDKELRKALRGEEGFDSAKSESLRQEVTRMYKKKRRRALILAWAAIAVCNFVAIPAIVVFVLSGTTKVLIACAAVAIIAGQVEILTKFWYWVVHGRLLLQEEIKELQLQIAELAQERKKKQQSEQIGSTERI